MSKKYPNFHPDQRKLAVRWIMAVDGVATSVSFGIGQALAQGRVFLQQNPPASIQIHLAACVGLPEVKAELSEATLLAHVDADGEVRMMPYPKRSINA